MGGHDEVAACDVLAAEGERLGVAGPFVGGVDDDLEARHLGAEAVMRARGGAGQVAVHGDDHDLDGNGRGKREALSEHSAPLRRRGFRG